MLPNCERPVMAIRNRKCIFASFTPELHFLVSCFFMSFLIFRFYLFFILSLCLSHLFLCFLLASRILTILLFSFSFSCLSSFRYFLITSFSHTFFVPFSFFLSSPTNPDRFYLCIPGTPPGGNAAGK